MAGIKSYDGTIQVKVVNQYLPVVTLIYCTSGSSFESVDQKLQYGHLNESSVSELSYGAVRFPSCFKIEFWIFLEFCFWRFLGVKSVKSFDNSFMSGIHAITIACNLIVKPTFCLKDTFGVSHASHY